jgi:hypothetical protein
VAYRARTYAGETFRLKSGKLHFLRLDHTLKNFE